MKINETRARVRNLVLRACRTNGLRVVNEDTQTLQGVHPLIDGMYMGNGTTPGVFRRVPAAVEVMKANPEVEEFKLALSILYRTDRSIWRYR